MKGTKGTKGTKRTKGIKSTEGAESSKGTKNTKGSIAAPERVHNVLFSCTLMYCHVLTLPPF